MEILQESLLRTIRDIDIAFSKVNVDSSLVLVLMTCTLELFSYFRQLSMLMLDHIFMSGLFHV